MAGSGRTLLCFVALLGLGVLVAVGLALPKPVHACSCVSPGSPAEALSNADSVFAGKVVAIRPTGHPPFRLSSADPVMVEFEVTQIWKGTQERTVTIETKRSEVSCGYDFTKGLHYIVYARDGRTGLCSRTAPAWRAFEDLVALGPGMRPEPGPMAETGAGRGCGAAMRREPSRVDVAALVLLAGVVGLGVRRRPRL